MPEPNTVSAPNPSDEPDSTKDWAERVALSGGRDAAETATRTDASTPGPGDPARHTVGEDTELLSPLNSDGTPRLPDIPGYRVETVLGRGGMGVVYRAVDLALGRVVALKVMHPGGRDYSHVLGRFDREVKALAEIDHPNIVRIHHAGDWHGFPFFTMQFVPGGPLSLHAARFRGDHRACARLVAKVARAVQTLHDRKVIHRDLKPLNILMGAADEPLVADFGLAKWLDEDPQSDYSQTGAPIGTRQYMAPEQTLGKRSDYSVACDVWSIGVVLYELLAGRRPFADDGKTELFKRIREEPPPSLPADVPPDLSAVVEKCLAKVPADRYATAAAVADDLEAWLEGRPISVRPARPANRWALAAALVALAALIALPAVAMLGGSPPPPPRKKTIAERLADDETIWLIDGQGKLLVAPRAIPDCEGSLAQGKTGHATLSSAVFAAVELSGEPLPWPVRFRAEYAFDGGQDERSRAGVYAGRRHAPAADPCGYLIQVVHTQSAVPTGKSESRLIEQAAVEPLIWSKLGSADFRKTYSLPPRVTTVREEDARALRWQTVDVVIRPDTLSGNWNGVEFEPLSGARAPGRAGNRSLQADLEAWSRTWAKRNPGGTPAAFAEPYIGDGIGVCVFNATSVYRNVTLSRASP